MLPLIVIFNSYGEMELVMTIILLTYIIPLVLGIFYLITLQNALKSIDVKHRSMNPGGVWFMLVPLLNFIWAFVVVYRVADSIKNELNARGRPCSEKPTYHIGFTWCTLSIISRIPFGGDMPLNKIFFLDRCYSLYYLSCLLDHPLGKSE